MRMSPRMSDPDECVPVSRHCEWCYRLDSPSIEAAAHGVARYSAAYLFCRGEPLPNEAASVGQSLAPGASTRRNQSCLVVQSLEGSF